MILKAVLSKIFYGAFYQEKNYEANTFLLIHLTNQGASWQVGFKRYKRLNLSMPEFQTEVKSSALYKKTNVRLSL